MEDGKASNNNSINEEENPRNSNLDRGSNFDNNNGEEGRGGSGRRRTPFTDLSQVEADLALARTLQEQERAYMMLRMNGGEGSDYGSWETESYGHGDEDDEDFDDHSEEEYEGNNAEEGGHEEDDQEEAFNIHEHDEAEVDENQNFEIDPSAYSSDEAYARALQDAEEREIAARLLSMAGINDMVVGEDEAEEGHGDNSSLYLLWYLVAQNTPQRIMPPSWCLVQMEVCASSTKTEAWDDVDPDELSYEELLALGEVIGTESKGLSAVAIASLPLMSYKSQSPQNGSRDTCVICRLDYEDGETLTVLSCKHSYHSECINNWLQINKVCPVCSTEVSTSGNI